MIKKILLFLMFLVTTHLTTLNSINKIHYTTISIPKAGTHLLLKTLKLIEPNITTHITPNGYCLIDDRTMKSFLLRSVFLATHAIYSEENNKKLNRNDIKTFFIYRDPRDQIVSAAYYIKKQKNIIYSTWDINSIIDELIKGGGSMWQLSLNSKYNWTNLKGIVEFYNLYLPWQFRPNVYTTTFEKLIGPQGGGDQKTQLNEIIALAQHMDKTFNLEKANNIAKKIFGATPTFREGKIGAWRSCFLPRHKTAFKNIPGACDLLIQLNYEKDSNW